MDKTNRLFVAFSLEEDISSLLFLLDHPPNDRLRPMESTLFFLHTFLIDLDTCSKLIIIYLGLEVGINFRRI